jgi:hypothetical protein
LFQRARTSRGIVFAPHCGARNRSATRVGGCRCNWCRAQRERAAENRRLRVGRRLEVFGAHAIEHVGEQLGLCDLKQSNRILKTYGTLRCGGSSSVKSSASNHPLHSRADIITPHFTWNTAHINLGEVSGARNDFALHALALRPQQQLQLGRHAGAG